MDQTLELKPGNRRLAVENLCDHIAAAVDAAPAFEAPFTHLVLDRVFPLEAIGEAEERVGTKHVTGKVVIRVAEGPG